MWLRAESIVGERRRKLQRESEAGLHEVFRKQLKVLITIHFDLLTRVQWQLFYLICHTTYINVIKMSIPQ